MKAARSTRAPFAQRLMDAASAPIDIGWPVLASANENRMLHVEAFSSGEGECRAGDDFARDLRTRSEHCHIDHEIGSDLDNRARVSSFNVQSCSRIILSLPDAHWG